MNPKHWALLMGSSRDHDHESREHYDRYDRRYDDRGSRDRYEDRERYDPRERDYYRDYGRDYDRYEPRERREGRKRKSEKLSTEDMEDWMAGLENDDGTTGAHWTMAQTNDVRTSHGLTCPAKDFYVALNMMYSDFSNVAKKFNVNTVDFYTAMAAAFLDDPDAAPGKLANYYRAVVCGDDDE